MGIETLRIDRLGRTEFFGERIPRALPQAKRANQNRTSSLGIGGSPELSLVNLQAFPLLHSQKRFRSGWLDRVRVWVEYSDWDERILLTERKMKSFCYALLFSFSLCILSFILKVIV